MPLPSSKGRRAISPAAAAGTILIALILVILSAMFLQYRTVDLMEQSEVTLKEGVTELDLNIGASRGEVVIGFAPLGGNAVELTAHVKGTASYFGDGSVMALDISNTTSDGRLTVSAFFDTYAPWPYYALDEVSCQVLIDSDLPTTLDINVATGGATVRTVDGVKLNGLSLDVTNLGATVALNNGTVLAGDMNIRSATGTNALYWNNLIVIGDRTVQMEESSGKMTIKVFQDTPMEGAVSIVGEDRAGSVELTMDIGEEVSAAVEGDSRFGTVNLTNEGGFYHSENALISDNHPAAMRFDVQLNSTVGDIEAWCRRSS